MRTKTCSRSYNDTGFFHKFHAECHTVSTSSRDFGPYKHSSLSIRKIPANTSESLAESISSFLIHLALFLYTFQWTPQSCNGCFLNRKEHTEVNLASQLAKCCDHIRTAYQKTDTCTGYIERFGQAEKFYAHFSGSRYCQKTSTMCAVINNIAVSIVMNDQNIIFIGKLDDFLIKSRCGNASYRIGRQGYDHIFRPSGNFLRDIFYIWKEIMFCYQWIIIWPGSCHKASCCKDRITWIWKEYGISLIAECHTKMSHSLLASINAHNHIRSQFHIKTLLIVITHCIQKFRQITKAVLPAVIIHSCLCQCLLDVLRCLEIRCSNTHIIYFHSLLLQFHAPVIQCSKDFFSKSVQSL